MTGQEIKALILQSGLKCWQVADALGMQDSNFSRRLRKPFDEKAAAQVKAAIASDVILLERRTRHRQFWSVYHDTGAAGLL